MYTDVLVLFWSFFSFYCFCVFLLFLCFFVYKFNFFVILVCFECIMLLTIFLFSFGGLLYGCLDCFLYVWVLFIISVGEFCFGILILYRFYSLKTLPDTFMHSKPIFIQY